MLPRGWGSVIWPTFQIVALKSSLTKIPQNCDIANHLFVTMRTRFRDFAKQIHWNLASPSFIKIVILHQIVQNQAALCLEIKMPLPNVPQIFSFQSRFWCNVCNFEIRVCTIFCIETEQVCRDHVCHQFVKIYTIFNCPVFWTGLL